MNTNQNAAAPWNPEEIKFLRKNFPAKGRHWCSEQLGRSANACSKKAHTLGIPADYEARRENLAAGQVEYRKRIGCVWAIGGDGILRDVYPAGGSAAVQAKIHEVLGRDVLMHSVKARAQILGVRVGPEFRRTAEFRAKQSAAQLERNAAIRAEHGEARKVPKSLSDASDRWVVPAPRYASVWGYAQGVQS